MSKKGSWLDRAILAAFPGWGVKRMANRYMADEIRRSWNYDSGDGGARNHYWRAVNESGEQTDKWDRNRVRARARDLERNSDQMNAVIDAVVRSVYGPGWELQAKVGDGEKKDYTKLNKQIEAAWKKWKKARNCDVTGAQSFDEMIRMCVRRKKVDGGILIVKRFTPKNDGFIPFKLQIFEVDELDETRMTPKYKGNTVVGGIEYNSWNRPKGYWFRQYDITGMQEVDSVFIPADDVIFYFTKTRPSQIREMSDMSPTITRIRDVNQYLEAVAVKERIQACFAVFFKPQTTAGMGFGRSGVKTEDSGGYLGKTLSPGMMQELPAGEEPVSVNPSGQAQNAAEFVKLQQKMLAAGQGMSYEAVSRDMSETNYSSARQSAIEDERTFAAEQESLEAVLDEIYETFVISLVLSGKVQINDFWEDKDKYLSHAWIRPAKKWIDPVKEANANVTALKSGQKTFQQLCAESGCNWKDVLDETSEAFKYADKLGIDLTDILLTAGGKPVEDKGTMQQGGEENEPKKPEEDGGNSPEESNAGGDQSGVGGSGKPDVSD